MPVLHSTYTPTTGPKFNPRANLINISNFNGTTNTLARFTTAQKCATFDLIVALGLRAPGRSPTHLRDDVDLAHLRNKTNRSIHENYTAVLFEGIVRITAHHKYRLLIHFAVLFDGTRRRLTRLRERVP